MNIKRGYKLAGPDGGCMRRLQKEEKKFEVGKEYKTDDFVKVGKGGFHYCTSALGCLRYKDGFISHLDRESDARRLVSFLISPKTDLVCCVPALRCCSRSKH